MQLGRSAPKEGDTVTAAHEPGPGNIHSIWLAMTLRYLAIILLIHLHLLSLASTFATVFLQLPYVYLWDRTQAYVPLHDLWKGYPGLRNQQLTTVRKSLPKDGSILYVISVGV